MFCFSFTPPLVVLTAVIERFLHHPYPLFCCTFSPIPFLTSAKRKEAPVPSSRGSWAAPAAKKEVFTGDMESQSIQIAATSPAGEVTSTADAIHQHPPESVPVGYDTTFVNFLSLQPWLMNTPIAGISLTYSPLRLHPGAQHVRQRDE